MVLWSDDENDKLHFIIGIRGGWALAKRALREKSEARSLGEPGTVSSKNCPHHEAPATYQINKIDLAV